MKILILLEGRGVGGNEVLLKSLIQNFLKKRHQVLLCTTESAVRGFFSNKNVQFVRCPHGKSQWEKLLRRLKPNLTMGVHGDIFSMAIASRLLNIKTVWIYGHPGFMSGLGREELEIGRVCFDRVIAQSEFLASSFSKRENVEVIHNGTSTGRFKPLPRKKSVLLRRQMGLQHDAIVALYPARWAAYKRQDFLIKALASIFERDPRLHLLLVGSAHTRDGHLFRKKVHEIVQTKSFSKRILFVESRYEKMKGLLSVADFCVFPAVNEGFGIALIEAMAMSKLVIASQSGGHREIVSRKSGLSFDTDQPNALKRQVSKAMNDNTLVQHLAKGARRHVVKNFSIEKAIQRYNSVVEELLST